MTEFAVLAALLATAVAAAISWPFWRRRRAGSAGRGELPTWAWIALAGAPAAGALGYVIAVAPGQASVAPPATASEAPHGLENRKVAATAERLASRLRANPEDGQGWATLGRSLAALGRFPEAAQALEEASRRLPANAAVLADRADVLAMAQGRRFAGEPDRLIQEALEADPRHLKALALAGSSAFDRGDYAVAAKYWRRLLAVAPPGGAMAREVEARSREAERRAGAAGSAAITGTVAFAPGEARATGPGDVVFVVARPRDGHGRPIAVARIPGAPMPAPFRLGDGDSLVAGTPLSGFSEVLLEARLARGGSADPQPGDPRSTPRAARPGERSVSLELRAPPD
ncbi:MAG: hypothetical protein C3F16_07975 [Betaproteobacteria bacterium]|nr:MAG: hypothetical protein C3F16_07975 [Betaproteobacteria bacterium]